MIGLLGWIGATLGGALGWWLGERLGIMAAWFLSAVGTAFGLYWGRKIGRDGLG